MQLRYIRAYIIVLLAFTVMYTHMINVSMTLYLLQINHIYRYTDAYRIDD